MNINECSDITHNCDSNAFCIDTTPDYRCTCKEGYEGQGFPDFGVRGSGRPAKPLKGQGFYCTIIDHCKSNPCPLTAVCSSSLAGPSCTCHEGYIIKTTLDNDGNTVFEDCEKIPDEILKASFLIDSELSWPLIR